MGEYRGWRNVSEREIKKSITELSPIDVYMLLPRTNCKECGETNCMAFATKLGRLPPITRKGERSGVQEAPGNAGAPD